MLRFPKVFLVVAGAFALAMGCSSSGADDDGDDDTSSSSGGGGGNGSSGSSGSDVDGSTQPGKDGGNTTADGGGDCSVPCGLGTAVCEGNAVRTCEASAECNAFSAPVACPADTFCTAGVCSDTCTDACPTVGAKECSGSAGIRECVVGAGGCKDWSAPTACGGDLVCSGGACVASCTDQCAAGATKCADGQSTQTCEQQASGCLDWSVSSACANGGSCSGAGVCTACTDGSKRCGPVTGNVETCNAASWTESNTCSFGCTGGACNTSVACTPGNYRCNGLATEVCNATGSAYLHTSTCAVACNAGLCTGTCTPGTKRCNQNGVETCAADGASWTVTSQCPGSCDAVSTTCVVPSIDVQANTNLDGDVVVSGDVIVRSGATLHAPSGALSIRARSITVELGGSITAAAKGADPALAGSVGTGDASCYSYGGGAGRTAGLDTDAVVGVGGQGGAGGRGCSTANVPGAGGLGGGVLRLIAGTVNVAGTITATGAAGGPAVANYTSGGGGGGGGGVLIASNTIVMSGSISVSPGAGGARFGNSSYSRDGSTGTNGRVKLLGANRTVTGTVIGGLTVGQLPPLVITSGSHPLPTRVYNDDFVQGAFTWERPSETLTGYYVRLSNVLNQVPTPANAIFNASELRSFPRDAFVPGNNWLHIVPVNAASEVGLVENRMQIVINATPPVVTSTSHVNSNSWLANDAPFFTWTHPTIPEASLAAFHYVFDHYGTTVPTKADAALPASQKTKLQPGVEPGIWAMHVIGEDTRGYLTKQAGHYVVRIGANPGNGSVLGTVTATAGGAPISGATITVNRQLIVGTAPDQNTNAAGSYNFATVPAGTWELTVSKAGFAPKTANVVVTANAASTVNVTLDP